MIQSSSQNASLLTSSRRHELRRRHDEVRAPEESSMRTTITGAATLKTISGRKSCKDEDVDDVDVKCGRVVGHDDSRKASVGGDTGSSSIVVRTSQRGYPLAEDVDRLTSHFDDLVDCDDEHEARTNRHDGSGEPNLCHEDGSKHENDDREVDDDADDDDDFVLEVAPGVVRTVRGANHVTRAWRQRGATTTCIEAVCFLCDIRLACTEVCEAVVCPLCLAVSPVEGGASSQDGEGYVGIGLEI